MWGSDMNGRRGAITRLAAMLGRTRIALLAGVLAIGIGGCGGDDGTIPKSDSENLLGLLASLEEQVQAHQCAVAEGTAGQIDAAVKSLPSDVDQKVQEALNKAAEHLATLTNDPDQSVEAATGVDGVQPDDTTTTTTTTESSTTADTTADETSTPEDDTGDQAPPTDTHETPPNGENQGPAGGGDQPAGGEGAPASGGVTPGGKR
jgi:hypothetical protein